MKFSRNPKSGLIESYSDDGFYLGLVYTMGDIIESYHKSAQDGGPGSGNFGHKGRPGEVGGSGEGDGSSSQESKSTENKNIPPRVKKHVDDVKRRLRSAVESDKYSGKDGWSSSTNYVSGYVFGESVFNDMKNEELVPILERYIDLLGSSGEQPEKMVDHSEGKVSKEEGIKLLKSMGYSDKEAEDSYSKLLEYTEGDWKKVDQKFLEDYVDKRLKSKGAYSGCLYRGQHITTKEFIELKKQLETGIIKFDRVCSWSAKAKTADEFAEGEHYKNENPKNVEPVVFCVAREGNKTAVPVTEFSRFFLEKEMLSAKGAEYSVISHGWVNGGVSGGRKYYAYVVTLVERSKENGK